MTDEPMSSDQFHQVKSFFRDNWVEVQDEKKGHGRETKGDSKTIDTNSFMKTDRKKNERLKKKDVKITDPKPEDDKTNEKKDTHTCILVKRDDEHPLTESQNQSKKKPTTKDNQGGILETPEVLLLEHKRKYEALIDAYQNETIHGSLTLDEWYYQFASSDAKAVKDRSIRNRTQVVTKELPCSARNKSYWPLIRVNQLCVWTIGERWIITASFHSIDGRKRVLLDGVLDHLNKQTESGRSRSQPASTTEMRKVIIEHCIASYERSPKTSAKTLGKASNQATRKASAETLRGTIKGPASKVLVGVGLPDNRRARDFPPELLSMRQMFSNSINQIAVAETNLFQGDEFWTKQ
ncbi:hypothetical protein CSAL01_04179 [Colletotrichum salicis]|uniref:Uncharacterized protein n=1 Tax=Colletotrichum salicis TaxID=1209931 RepID=A0A135UGX4_9PEZI|nr:hypothetical protein CSAL01_04179 [Colletotrichum salicis]